MNDVVINKKEVTKEQMKLSGEHLKRMQKVFGFTYQDLLDLFADEFPLYSQTRSLSPFFNGKKILDSEKINAIAKKFHVRAEYIAGIDNYMTEEEMTKDALSEYKAIINYLDTLGFSFVPGVFWVATPYNIYKDYLEMKDYITEYCLKGIKKFLELPTSDSDINPYSDSHFENPFYIELKQDPSQTLKEVSKINKTENDLNIFDIDSEYKQGFDDYNSYCLLYKIFKNNKLKGFLTIKDAMNFFKHIDSLCKCSIESLISSSLLK